MKIATALGKSLLPVLLLCSACKVGLDYEKPADQAPAQWISAATDADAAIEQDWWKHLNDPVLDQLITRAIADNLDLKIAAARIDASRAARSTAFNNLLPTVNIDANAERQANRLAIGNTPFNLSKPFNTFQTGFDASWELDLFGGRRRAFESSSAELEAVETTGDDARVSLLAEVARTYVDIRQYQSQLAIARDTVKAEDQTARIAGERFKVGQAAGLDAIEAEAQVKLARAQIPYYENLLQQTQYSMDVLLAAKPGTARDLTQTTAPIPMGDRKLVLAAPARIIAHRPDVVTAERRLASATAQRGTALAQFFPDISLSGFLGLLTADSDTLLQGSSKSWDIGGNILWPILNYGKLSANLHASDARQQEALLNYRKAVIAALSDVERSVSAYTKEDEHQAALEEAGRADAKAVQVARERYKDGLSSFIEVLDAERALYSAQSQATTSKALTAQNLIAVYKSLGGGWEALPSAPKKP